MLQSKDRTVPTIKVEVHRGRKISANYQSQDASISIVGSIDVPTVNPDSETSPTSDEAAATVRDQIQWLWQLAEDELAAKVAELTEQPLEAPTAQQPEQHQQYQPAQQNGYSTGGDPYGPPKQQRTWGGGAAAQPNPAPVPRSGPFGGYPSQQRSTGGYGGGGAPAGGRRVGDLPKAGRQVFAWAKKQEEQRGEGLIKHITTYVKNQGIDGRMMDWSPDTTALAVAEAIRCLQG